MVNDIVRLCRIFKIDIPEAKPDTWPRLTVEFESLRDKTIEGTFEFIDLPGVGEAHSDFHSFEDLVRIAAKEADTVVPIISFKEVAKGDWRKQLPQIVQTGLKRPPDFVLCTHMDQVQTKSRVTEQVHSVGKEFWPTITDFERRVLRCSTRLGIGAHLLITQSQQKKPKFENIWKENTILFDCVEKILGVGDSKSKYEELKREEWIEALEVQLKNSRLQDAMSQLTAGIVNSAQGLALQLEGRKLMLMMKKIASDQKRSLVEISRTRDEFEQAYKAFQQAQHKFKGFRGICEEESKKLRNSAELKLDRAFAILEQNGQKSAVLAVEDATKRVEHRAPKSGTLKSNEIVFSTKFEVEKFFYMAQDKMAQDAKNDLSREFVGFVRELADRSRLQLFELLVQKLESVTKEKQAPPELVDDILEQLNYQKQDVEVLFSATVKTKAVRTDVERHNVATAYTAIKDAMSKPFMHSSESVDLDDNASNITETTSSQTDSTVASELGFMIRAPIAVLATIPLLLGSLVWPWLVHRKKFVIDKDVLAKHFQEQIQKPFFAELKKEAQKTVDTVIGKSSELAQRIVNDSLKEEQARFEHENDMKNTSDEERAGLSTDIVSTFWNLSAAEKGLDVLQGKFDEVLQKA
ncbi:hypothetical protein SCHPADRAFT_823483 [Schizopora paradoxa]|uniref:Uncharacterized protein n=1 Tax=Schizopora paradoxa TaxID=27342 RepID=A0A0H2SGR0_9AGAM|nr:hypothetical protein SCHPADRAFT_823483 [Schizopora paradoxa]